MLVAPPPGEGVHPVEVAIGHILDQLRRRGVIRHRPDQADPSRRVPFPCPVSDLRSSSPRPFCDLRGASFMRLPGSPEAHGQRDELIEPAIGDDRVVVEQHQILAAGGLQALVDRPRGTRRFWALAMMVTGTGAASWTPAR